MENESQIIIITTKKNMDSFRQIITITICICIIMSNFIVEWKWMDKPSTKQPNRTHWIIIQPLSATHTYTSIIQEKNKTPTHAQQTNIQRDYLFSMLNGLLFQVMHLKSDSKNEYHPL